MRSAAAQGDHTACMSILLLCNKRHAKLRSHLAESPKPAETQRSNTVAQISSPLLPSFAGRRQ